MGFRVFVPLVAACPGCGRTTSTTFQELAARHPELHPRIDAGAGRSSYPGVEALNVAVMGCIVNGPGESKHADIGISLPGTGEAPAAPVFIDGKKADDAARPDGRGRLQAAGDRLHRAPLRRTAARGAPRRSKFFQGRSAVLAFLHSDPGSTARIASDAPGSGAPRFKLVAFRRRFGRSDRSSRTAMLSGRCRRTGRGCSTRRSCCR